VKALLFLSSYIPLYVIVIVRNYSNQEVLVFFIILILATGGALVFTLWGVARPAGEYLKMDRVEDISSVNLGYFAAYVIPFLATDFASISDVISFCILLAIIGVMYMKSDLVYMNPTLALLGFNIYKISIDKDDLVLITRRRKNDLATAKVIRIATTVFISK
jgi:hypothetical protein